MDTYEFIKESKEKLDYCYYLELKINKKADLTTIDRTNEKIDLTKVAKDDYELNVTLEDLNRIDRNIIVYAEK